jgi:hypothetical protein
MVEHVCQNCKKTFKIHTNFINHTQKRKTPCIPIVQNIIDEQKILPQNNPDCPFLPIIEPVLPIIKNIDVPDNNILIEEKKLLINRTCNYCEKIFTRGTHMRRHLNICKMKIKNDEIEILTNKILLLKEENEKLKKSEKINNKKINNKNTKNENTNIINNINIQNININNNVEIKYFLINHGQENYNDIELDNILNNDNVTLKFIETLHCNKNKPEWQNVLITDATRNNIFIYNNKKWILENKINILHNILGRTIKYLNTKKEDETNNKTKFVKYDNEYKIIVGDFSNFNIEQYKKHKKIIGNLIYNNKKMIVNNKNIEDNNNNKDMAKINS